ncbi:MAG: SPFH domain-containing protein [bacterium]|nr:SPFH domain-containing protein [bacterium]
MSYKLIGGAVGAVALIIMSFMMFGVNYAGYRTVVQYPSGTIYVKFTPGIYVQWFGHTETYPDIITYDFDKMDDKDTEKVSIQQKGVPVRYQDGGTGTVYGKARFDLPDDEVSMVSLHKAFRSGNGVAFKLIKPVTEEAMNLTAGLMSSEEAYTEKRGTYTQWARDQVQSGKYKTRLETKVEKEVGTDREVVKNVPVIAYGDNGLPIHLDNDLKTYSVTVSGFQVVDWDFEQKTLDQIAAKREATMGIITAKANADRAKQDAITAEATGQKNVMEAKYRKEVAKEEAVVEARQKKEVAVIGAQQLVDVAEKGKLEAEQKKLGAVEYKQEQTLRGEGDAAYKQAVIEADGALAQKLKTYETVMATFAVEFGKQKWVPEVQMGKDSGEGGSNPAADLIKLLTATTLKDLGLDMKIREGSSPTKKK